MSLPAPGSSRSFRHSSDPWVVIAINEAATARVISLWSRNGIQQKEFLDLYLTATAYPCGLKGNSAEIRITVKRQKKSMLYILDKDVITTSFEILRKETRINEL